MTTSTSSLESTNRRAISGSVIPAGTSGFRDLFQDADRFEIGRGVRPYVASLDDLDRIVKAISPELPEGRTA